MSRSWSKGSTRRWRRARALILARDGHTCQLRLEGCTGHATQVHHIRGKAYGDDPNNLVASCAPCNQSVGDPNRRQHDPNPTPRSNW